MRGQSDVKSLLAHRLLSSSFLGVPCRILKRNHKKELLWSLWVVISREWKRTTISMTIWP